ncbi:hypothetical protein [Steroidobacter denitrificans]|nr:hypothetical protein [Steroidobacter denitrificans]
MCFTRRHRWLRHALECHEGGEDLQLKLDAPRRFAGTVIAQYA